MTVGFLWTIPVLSSIFATFAFVIGYSVGVARKDEAPWFSFISDGGTLPPESCIFGQLLNMAAVTFGVTAYLRYHQYKEFHTQRCRGELGWRRRTNVVMLIIGYVSAFGVSLVGNFQELNVPFMHFGGALTAFFGGLIYLWGQVVLAYAQKPRMTPLLLNHMRFVLAFICTVAFFLYMVANKAQPFVKSLPGGGKPTMPPSAAHKVTQLDPDSPFYVNHLIACINEWIMGLGFQVVMLSFGWELAEFEMHPPKIVLKGSSGKETHSSSGDTRVDNHNTGKANGHYGNKLPDKGVPESVWAPAENGLRPAHNGSVSNVGSHNANIHSDGIKL